MAVELGAFASSVSGFSFSNNITSAGTSVEFFLERKHNVDLDPRPTGLLSNQISRSSCIGQTLIGLLCLLNPSVGCLAREVSSIYWPFLLSEKASEMSLMGQAFPKSRKNALFAMD